jgi:D-aspartate ligase
MNRIPNRRKSGGMPLPSPQMMPDLSTPVVVLRGVAHGGLGITRSLGSWGVPVYTVESKRLTPAFYSRYSRGNFLWNLEEHRADESVSFLRSVADKLGRDALLFPTSDRAAIFLAENADALTPWFTFSRQAPELVKCLCSKREMYWRATRHGLPVPETRFPTTRAEIANFATMLNFPVVLKAIDGDRISKRLRRRMFIVHSSSELMRAYEQINDPQNVVLQDYIPGQEDNCWIFHAYFNHNSECVAAFTAKKLRQCPAYAGATSLAVSRKNAVVEATLIRFLQAIGYTGLVDIDIRYDARDGLYKVLDINPRIGANFRLFVSANGFDLARIYYLEMTGQCCDVESIREGRKWLVEDFDLVASLRYWVDGNLELRGWFMSLRDIDEYGYLNLKDPLPALARLVADVVSLARRSHLDRSPSTLHSDEQKAVRTRAA